MGRGARAAAEGPTAVARLDGLTRRLRSECPWDREQDERSIVPHTVEEAYELADAANSGDDARLLDELGDVLFQVHFLALLLEERGAGDLAAVADHCSRKLIRRHPHVFGEVEAADAQAVLERWDAIKRAEEGRPAGAAGDLPGNLPATIYARKLQRRVAAGGRRQPDAGDALTAAASEATRLAAALPDERGTAVADQLREERFERIGELLYATVAAAGELGVERCARIGELLSARGAAAGARGVEAELPLRAAADRRRVEGSGP